MRSMPILVAAALAATTLRVHADTAPQITKLEQSVINDISEKNLVYDLDGIAAFDRTSGLGGDRDAALFIKKQLDSYGVPNEIYHFRGYVSDPGDAGLTILSEGGRKVAAKTFSFAVPTPPGGVEGDLVFLDYNVDPLESIDKPLQFDVNTLKGKIVLVSGLPVPQVVDQIQAAGAIGAIFTSTNSHGGINEFIVTNIWGTPATDTAHMLPTMSSINISQADSKAFETALKAGKRIHVRFDAKVDTGWKDLYLPVATIHGQSDDFAMFGSHLCSWYIGATDNAAANAVGVELARDFYQHRAELKRSVKIAWWPAHSQGRYAGSAWFADNAWSLIDKHAVATLNGDLWGMAGANEWSTISPNELTPFINQLMEDGTGSTHPNIKPNRHSDESFLGIGVPGTLLRHTIRGEERPWYWHSETDTIDKVDPAVMHAEATMAARYLTRMVSDEVLPQRFSGVAAQIVRQVDAYAKSSQGLFSLEDAQSAAQDLLIASEAADKALDAGATGARADRINHDVMRLSRVLNPVLFTVDGRFHPDDAYPKALIPGLYDVTRLQLKSMSENDRGFSRVYLVRERTRLIDALERATALMKDISGTEVAGL